MNNKLIITLLIFISLFCFNKTVYGQTNKDVVAKYIMENGSIFYEKTLEQNNEINIPLDDRTITIKSDNLKDNGTSIILIPVTSNAFDWITSDYSDKSNLKGYYIDFYKNNEKTALNGSINIKTKSCSSCNLEKVYLYDLNKNILSSTNNIDNNMNVNINKSGYLLFNSNALKTIDLEISNYGDIVVDNKAYSGNTKLYSDSKDKEIAIRPNLGYIIDKVILNNNDITEDVSANYLKLKLDDTNNLKVTFKKETITESKEKIKISGVATYNGEPVKNAKVWLHNNSLVTYTDEEGNYTFNDVEPGNYSISFEKNNSVIGYSTFKVTASDKKDTNISLNNDVVEIEVNNKSKTLNVDFSLEDDLRINYSNVYTIIKGDVNCDGLVNVTDLVQLRMYLAGLKTLTNRGLEAANLKEDNKIDITDLIKLRRYLAGLEKI